jgi:hypothetical protein
LTKVNLGIDTHGEGVVDGPIGTYVLGRAVPWCGYPR